MINRGEAVRSSLPVTVSDPSPLPVDETIKRSRLKIINPQIIAIGIVAYHVPNIVWIANPMARQANTAVANTIPPMPMYFMWS